MRLLAIPLLRTGGTSSPGHAATPLLLVPATPVPDHAPAGRPALRRAGR